MKGGCPGQAPNADGEYNFAFNMERRRAPHISARSAEYKQGGLDRGNNRSDSCLFGHLDRNELRRHRCGVLPYLMANSNELRGLVEYRGYSLQLSYASPQWQVLIGMVVKDRPTLPPGKQIVKGWNEEETLKRAKNRIDLLIESPSLH